MNANDVKEIIAQEIASKLTIDAESDFWDNTRTRIIIKYDGQYVTAASITLERG